MLRAAAVALCAVFATAALDPMDRAHVVVQKTLVSPLGPEMPPVMNRTFELVYTIVNLGLKTATDIVVTDEFTSQFEIVSGNTTTKVASLDPGSNVSSTIVVRPLVAGVMNVSRAEVLYRYKEDPLEEGAEEEPFEVHAFSSTPGRVEILRPEYADRISKDKEVRSLLLGAGLLLAVLLPYYSFSKRAAANDAL